MKASASAAARSAIFGGFGPFLGGAAIIGSGWLTMTLTSLVEKLNQPITQLVSGEPLARFSV
jgi:hypothetical protein